jgi:F-type H+-transporting ATPase subunit b
MTIDWITVAAQLLNFLVLVWLLKRFLYRPILDGIDARESEIANRMGEASRIQNKAKTTVTHYQAKLDTLQEEQSRTLDRARQEAMTERDKLLNDARQRIREEHSAAKRQQHEQAVEYVAQLHRDSAQTLLSVIRKALQEMSDETLEERLTLHALTTVDRQEVIDRSTTAGKTLQPRITTRTALDAAATQRICESTEHIWPGCTVEFDTDAEQAPGVTVQFGSSQVAWTIDAYVDELQSRLNDSLQSSQSEYLAAQELASQSKQQKTNQEQNSTEGSAGAL